MEATNYEQFFLISLLKTLQFTREGSSVHRLEYLFEGEEKYVIIHFEHGSAKKVCVTADSNLAIITDVIRAIK